MNRLFSIIRKTLIKKLQYTIVSVNIIAIQQISEAEPRNTVGAWFEEGLPQHLAKEPERPRVFPRYCHGSVRAEMRNLPWPVAATYFNSIALSSDAIGARPLITVPVTHNALTMKCNR